MSIVANFKSMRKIMPNYINTITKEYRMNYKSITGLLAMVAATSTLVAMDNNQNNGQKNNGNYCRIDWDRYDQLTALTVYKPDLFLPRLVEKGIVKLEHIKEIHDEIDNGLTYHPDLLSKQHLSPAREACALRIAKGQTLELIDALRDSKKRKRFLDIFKSDAFAMVLISGTMGSGKSIMACALARAAEMNQMFVPATTLIDETSRGTMLRFRDLMYKFCEKKNTALILSDADCLFNNIQNKSIESDVCMAILRQSLNNFDKSNATTA